MPVPAVAIPDVPDLLTTPTLTQLDNCPAVVGRATGQLQDFIGKWLYWEQVLRPDRYAEAENFAQTHCDVSRSTLTRWRTTAQKKHHLEPPTAMSAGQQRAAEATTARNAKQQVSGKARETRSTREQGRRVPGGGAPIETTAHLAPASDSRPEPAEVVEVKRPKKAPAERPVERLSMRDAWVLPETLDGIEKYASSHGYTTGEAIDHLAARAGLRKAIGNGKTREEVSPRLKGL